MVDATLRDPDCQREIALFGFVALTVLGTASAPVSFLSRQVFFSYSQKDYVPYLPMIAKLMNASHSSSAGF